MFITISLVYIIVYFLYDSNLKAIFQYRVQKESRVIMKLIVHVILITFLFSTSSLQGQGKADLKKTITDKYRNYVSFFASKNAEAIARLYSTDGARLSKGSPDLIGRTNITNSLKDMFIVTGPVSVIIQSNELWQLDDKLYEGGKWYYSWTGPDNKTVLKQGEYLAIWIQKDGDWQLWRDISF